MPSLVGPSSTDADPRARVRITASLANRFYEPIVLFDVLNSKHTKKLYSSSEPDPSSNLPQSLEHIFHCFVNKLAQLCDASKGAQTVTAFTVLQYPDRIEYRFTSNQREIDDFVHAQSFITSILHILGNMKGQEKQSVISNILRTSLSFNRPRVTVYMRTLKARARLCIAACKAENTDESRSILKKLSALYELQISKNETLKDDEFAKHCESLLKSIDLLHQSEVYELIYNRTKEGKIDESESWSELRHTAGRLLSYLQAAKFLVSIPKRWPELFDDPKVCYVMSSVADTCPFRGKNSPKRMTAEGIIGRMTSDLKKMEEHRAHAQELQKFGLDQQLQNQAQKLRPFVHAEVLLLDSLENDNGTHPTRFFKGYKYIGSSKPTCKLCCHYFSVHPSGVEVRQPHHNLYPSWRFPDVYEDQGSAAEKDMIKLMNKVLALVRTDAFRVLEEKVAEGKRHDSNTETSYPRDIASVGGPRDMEDMESTLGSRDTEDLESTLGSRDTEDLESTLGSRDTEDLESTLGSRDMDDLESALEDMDINSSDSEDGGVSITHDI